MAGGNWENQNKVRPGAYTNFETNDLATTGLDSVGAVVIPLVLDWGETGKFIPVFPNSKFKELFGKSLGDLLPVREAFKETGRVIVYNLSGSTGVKAKATSGVDGITATATHAGSDGNKISVTVTVGLTGSATVRTFYEGETVDSQVVTIVSDLKPNAYVTFTGDLPTADAVLTLSGGTTPPATNDSYADFAEGLDTQIFKVVAVGTDDETVKLLITLKIKQWRADEGKNVTLVTNDYKAADHEGVVSVLNGVTLTGGEELTAAESVYWYAAAYANSTINSLTYADYPGAIDVERLTHDQIVKALQDGHIVYTYNAGADGVDKIVVEQDINTFRSFTPIKNQDFRKNKIVRQMDIVANNVQHIWSRFFIGKVNNNEDGRNLFKGQVMTVILDPLVRSGAIEPYDPAELIFMQGAEKDAVLSNMGLKFTDAMEKLYMTVECK